MTTFPKHPAMKAAATVAQHGRDVTRAHARLDEDESVLSQHTAQIATANTGIAANATAITATNVNVTANTTAITAVNTGSGGTSQENFLGSLQQAVAPSNPATSGVGVITGTPTDTEFNSLNTAYNNCVSTIATLISRLEATGILS